MKKVTMVICMVVMLVTEGNSQPETPIEFETAKRRVNNFRSSYRENVINQVTLHSLPAMKNYLTKFDEMINSVGENRREGYKWMIGLYPVFHHARQEEQQQHQQQQQQKKRRIANNSEEYGRVSFLVIPTLYNRETNNYLDYFAEDGVYDRDQILVYNEGHLEPLLKNKNKQNITFKTCTEVSNTPGDEMGNVSYQCALELKDNFKKQFPDNFNNDVVLISRKEWDEYLKLFRLMTVHQPRPREEDWYVGFYPYTISEERKKGLGFYTIPSLYKNNPSTFRDYFTSDIYNRRAIKVHRMKQHRVKKSGNA